MEYMYLIPTIQKIALVIAVVGAGLFVWLLKRKPKARKRMILCGVVAALALFAVLGSASLFNNLEKLSTDVAQDPRQVPASLNRSEPKHVKIDLEVVEAVGKMEDGTPYMYWTFNKQVPGPMLRVRVGDTAEVTLKNAAGSMMPHNIDFHAATGPGGGAAVTNVAPGQSKTFSFKALNPGLYVYHCAFPGAAVHVTQGMYGMILVEPEGGLPEVDKEFYVMQGEFYSTKGFGARMSEYFDIRKMHAGQPNYVVFNGRKGSLDGKMQVNIGEKVRIYFGNGGVNLTSSFHIIGEIFDTVYPEASIGGSLLKNVQTTTVPAGGATIVEFTADVPGKYMLVDHALSRVDLGAMGMLEVVGEQNKDIFDGVADEQFKYAH